MDSFSYNDGTLFCEGVSLQQIASEIGTPFYVYSRQTLEQKLGEFISAFGDETLICFAVKSCSNIAVLAVLRALGSGADIVSGGELHRCLKAGIEPSKIVYAGVGKTEEEVRFALESGILMFNAESGGELELINRTAVSLGKKASVAVRVNPDVDAGTHPYISTGLKENKFGIPIDKALDFYRYAASLEGVNPVGVHCHIGSQITDVSSFTEAASIMAGLIKQLKAEGINIKYLDMGGGLGVSYNGEKAPCVAEYADAIRKGIAGLDVKLILEPGRNISADAGVLVTKVLYDKDTDVKKFKVVDAAMNDLMRPMLYGAYHGIKPVVKGEHKVKADIVGPVCETGDFIAKDRDVADVPMGGLYAVMSAGAYGMSMSSNYNSRPRTPEILVDGGQYHIIRRREIYEDLTGCEKVPSFLRK